MLLALPLPLLAYWLLPRAQQEAAALRVPFFDSLADTSSLSRSSGQNRLLRYLLIAMWCLLVFAAARPQWVGKPITLPTSGRDLMLAVDISGSMETPDMVVQGQQVPRITVIKHVVSEFVERRQGDRLGLIVFGTQAYLLAPLTFDRTTVKELLQETHLGFAGEQTAIGDAIGLAIKRLRDRPEGKRVLILLTDGANTAGEVAPRKAADLARQAGVKIYTIGLGAESMEVQSSLFSNFTRRINPSADLDEEALQYIADQTGGAYFRARNPQELAQIYALLDELEPVEQEDEVFRPTSALYYWPLGLALLLSFAAALWYLRSGSTAVQTEVSR
jgi:Ca-activated chloride channel family protein